MKVDLRGVHGFMSQPQSDDRAIYAVLQQVHRGAVTQDVWGNTCGFQRRTLFARLDDLLRQDVLDTIATKSCFDLPRIAVAKPRFPEGRKCEGRRCLAGSWQEWLCPLHHHS